MSVCTLYQRIQCLSSDCRDRIVGFLFGFSLASSYAAYHLLDEYKQASAALQASVEELQLSTAKVRHCHVMKFTYHNVVIRKVSAHIRRIEEVEKDLKALRESSSSKDDISRVRAEMKKLYDGLHVGKPPISPPANSCIYDPV